MSDSKPSMLSDLVKHAFTTAIGIIVTYFVTSAIKKDEYQQTDSDKEKQRMESLEKTSKLLGDYISRYDSLHVRYVELLERKNGYQGADNYNGDNTSGSQFNKVSQAVVAGNWSTPDGTIGWRFDGNKVTASGIGNYSGFIEGAGSYSASGGEVSGTMQITKAFYLPVNEILRFNFAISSDGFIMYGNTTDANGNVNAMTLNKY